MMLGFCGEEWLNALAALKLQLVKLVFHRPAVFISIYQAAKQISSHTNKLWRDNLLSQPKNFNDI